MVSSALLSELSGEDNATLIGQGQRYLSAEVRGRTDLLAQRSHCAKCLERVGNHVSSALEHIRLIRQVADIALQVLAVQRDELGLGTAALQPLGIEPACLLRLLRRELSDEPSSGPGGSRRCECTVERVLQEFEPRFGLDERSLEDRRGSTHCAFSYCAIANLDYSLESEAGHGAQ